jgi:hypothetical protein
MIYSSFSSDYYFSNLVWANGQTVSVTWMNREQTTGVVMLCKADSGDCIEVQHALSIDDILHGDKGDNPFYKVGVVEAGQRT